MFPCCWRSGRRPHSCGRRSLRVRLWPVLSGQGRCNSDLCARTAPAQWRHRAGIAAGDRQRPARRLTGRLGPPGDRPSSRQRPCRGARNRPPRRTHLHAPVRLRPHRLAPRIRDAEPTAGFDCHRGRSLSNDQENGAGHSHHAGNGVGELVPKQGSPARREGARIPRRRSSSAWRRRWSRGAGMGGPTAWR